MGNIITIEEVHDQRQRRSDLLAQIDSAFVADWLEHLRDERVPPLPAKLDDATSVAAQEPGGSLSASTPIARATPPG